VYLGDLAYEEATMVEKCLEFLKDKDDDEITPFLQVRNRWWW
jgi:hypothetical protein